MTGLPVSSPDILLISISIVRDHHQEEMDHMQRASRQHTHQDGRELC